MFIYGQYLKKENGDIQKLFKKILKNDVFEHVLVTSLCRHQ